jgi:hypothetical protein
MATRQHDAEQASRSMLWHDFSATPSKARSYLAMAMQAERQGDTRELDRIIIRAAKLVHKPLVDITIDDYAALKEIFSKIRERKVANIVYKKLERVAMQQHHPHIVQYEQQMLRVQGEDSQTREFCLSISTVRNFERLLLAIAVAKRWFGQDEVERLSRTLTERVRDLHYRQMLLAGQLEDLPVTIVRRQGTPHLLRPYLRGPLPMNYSDAAMLAVDKKGWDKETERIWQTKPVAMPTVIKRRTTTLRDTANRMLANYTERLSLERQSVAAGAHT